jgi:hypothetical protein
MIILLGALLVVICVGSYVFFVIGRRPPKYKVAAGGDLSKFFKALLYRGYSNGLMMIETPKRTEPFVQFSKYISGGPPGLQSHFPRAEWSLSYFAVLKVWLDNEGYAYEVIDADMTERPESYKPVHEFICVDFKQDIVAACKFARFALMECFGAPPERIFHLYFMNIGPLEEKIGF